MKKIIRKIQIFFDIENSLWKSNFRTLRQAGKASQNAHNPGEWLILKALLKNGVAEGVASDPHDPSAGEALAKPRFLDLPALASGAFDS